MDKHILIAGGAGFIGSHLSKMLINLGKKVVSLDNLSTGRKSNIEDLLGSPNFTFIESDTRDKKSLSNFTFSKIYDLASPASVTYISDHPIETATVNSIGVKNLLDLAKECNAAFLFASSSEVYGDPLEHPQKESYRGNVNPVGVRSGYDEGKRFGEALCMAYHREYGVNVKIVRIFNTYGPNSSIVDTRVVPQLVRQALLGEPLTVHGDGKQTRSFCFVSDMVEGIIEMMESSETGPINIGNPDEYTINDLASKIISMTGSSSKIKYVVRPKDDPKKRKPDIALAKKKLGWEPKVGLTEGLTKTIAYFRQVLKRK